MIEIHWLWMPLIVTLFCLILAIIFEQERDYGFFSILTVILGLISITIYLIVGIHWLFTHIKIVS